MKLAVLQWAISIILCTHSVQLALKMHSVHPYWHLTSAQPASIIHTSKQQRQWFNLFTIRYIEHCPPTAGKPTHTRKNKGDWKRYCLRKAWSYSRLTTLSSNSINGERPLVSSILISIILKFKLVFLVQFLTWRWQPSGTWYRVVSQK
jgi:hypothetical protein